MSTQLSSVDEILNILNQSSSKMVLSQNKNIVLFLGDTGSGKSTLAHFIGKDNRTLKSVELSAGQYLLVDDDGKISQNTTISETIIPELIEDTITKTSFYDCPGFNDTRTTATDIANAFSIHKIINHGNAFKIILVINYHSVTSGVDRRSFIELIRNVSNIIKDVDRYKDSIAAVVMKVDNTMIKEGNNFNLVSDQEVLNGIADFLEKVKQEIPNDRPYYKNAISLIEIFRTKNQENYKRLAILRRPMEKGPVNKIILLQNGKKSIQNILKNNIVFTKKRNNDFGYTISAESKNAIFELVVQINGNIRSIMKEIGQYIIKIYTKFEKNTNDLNEQINQFIRIQKYFLKFTKNISENMTLVDVISNLTKFLNKMDLQVAHNFLTNLFNCNDQLQFLENVSENALQIKPLEWILGFNELIEYVNDSKEWYMVLSELFTKLSTYDIQRCKNEFKINDLYETWISEKLLKTGADFKEHFQYFYSDDIGTGNIPRSIINIENIKVINYIKIRKLVDIFLYTLESDIQYITTDPTKNQIRGKYIIISQIPAKLLYSKKNFIELYAVNSVFIDEDLNLRGNKQKFVIAAPEWHIHNTVTINLNGKNKRSYVRDTANDGEDGKPGLPGGAAGTFFGIGELFTNLKGLIITANGGTGGDGQNGGNGDDGIKGKNPTLPKNFNQNTSHNDQLISTGFRFKHRPDLESDDVLNAAFAPIHYYYYEIFGTDGTSGSDGGNGGYRGNGGVSGKINIIDLRDSPKRLNYNSVDGKSGKEGVGGNGGVGGTNGKRIIAKYTHYLVPNVMAWTLLPIIGSIVFPAIVDNLAPAEWTVENEYSQGNKYSGDNGTDNENKSGYEKREHSVEIENIPNIIKEYKIFLKQNLNNSINKNRLSEFIQKIDKNAIINIIN